MVEKIRTFSFKATWKTSGGGQGRAGTVKLRLLAAVIGLMAAGISLLTFWLSSRESDIPDQRPSEPSSIATSKEV